MNQFLLLCTAFIFMFLFTIIAEQNVFFLWNYIAQGKLRCDMSFFFCYRPYS